MANAVSLPAWERLPEAPPINERSLAETLDGGQAFRWFRQPDGSWEGIWERNVVGLRLDPASRLEYRSPSGTPPGTILHYLGLDRIPGLIAALPCQADPVLEALCRKWGGLSLLRQPEGETLLAFICSSNKRIPQIRAMLLNLAAAFGEPVSGTGLNALPGWERLAEVREEDLRRCALGYRARHVAGTAAFLRGNPEFLQSIQELPLPEARVRLCRLPGVGPKVADCILLFGYGKCAAFPVDTWIARLMVRHYPELDGWTREQLATFARLHYGRAAGLAQQWLFADRSDPSD